MREPDRHVDAEIHREAIAASGVVTPFPDRLERENRVVTARRRYDSLVDDRALSSDDNPEMDDTTLVRVPESRRHGGPFLQNHRRLCGISTLSRCRAADGQNEEHEPRRRFRA